MKTMKISWGHKIIFAYSLFVAGIMLMVYLSSQENRDLVSEEYYADELAFQKIIDQSEKTAALSGPVEIERSQTELQIKLPQEFRTAKAEGTWLLYYAADQTKDITGRFTAENGNFKITVPEKASGQYLIKLQWTSSGTSYYFEKKMQL